MKSKVTCPICSHECDREYDTLEGTVCEDFIFCDHCGYWMTMSYSPAREGIDHESGSPESIKLRKEIYPLYQEKCRLIGLKICPCP